MSFTPTKNLTFSTDGLLVAVRFLTVHCNLYYECLGLEPHIAYSLRLGNGNQRFLSVGEAKITDQGIEVLFNIPVRELLIKKGLPVCSQEDLELSHLHGGDSGQLANLVGFIVGNYITNSHDYGFSILKENGGLSND